MLKFELLHPRMTEEHLGFLPSFLSEADPRSAAQQIDANYAHGGGWRPLAQWRVVGSTGRAQYPGDPSIMPIARAKLRDETLFFYQSDWLAIVQPDGRSEMSRVD